MRGTVSKEACGMMKLAVTLSAAIFAGLVVIYLALSADAANYVKSTFPFKVTVRVVHDGQVYSGAKVWSIHTWVGTSPTSMRQPRWSVIGEAIPIEAGSLGRIYFLKRSQDNVSTDTFGGFVQYCEKPPNEEADRDIIQHVESLSTFHSPCDQSQLTPIFVRAGPDPSMVIHVPVPWGADETCPGTCVLPVRIEQTTEPVTRTIIDELPWLKLNESPTALIGQPERRSKSVQSAFPPYYRQDFVNEAYVGSP
jgi:hypothetical protein